MADPTKDQLVALGKLSPPFDPVTEAEALHFLTGLMATLEHGDSILDVLAGETHEERLQLAGEAVISSRGQEQTGPLTAAEEIPPPAAAPVAVEEKK